MLWESVRRSSSESGFISFVVSGFTSSPFWPKVKLVCLMKRLKIRFSDLRCWMAIIDFHNPLQKFYVDFYQGFFSTSKSWLCSRGFRSYMSVHPRKHLVLPRKLESEKSVLFGLWFQLLQCYKFLIKRQICNAWFRWFSLFLYLTG